MTETDPIHLFVPTFRVDEVLEAVRECLEKGWTGLGFKTVEFEEKWRTHTRLPHAHFLSSASASESISLVAVPSILTSPELGISRQPIMFMKVDLPEPLAPMMATNSPGCTDSVTPRTA